MIISIHALLGRATGTVEGFSHISWISIHALLGRATRRWRCKSRASMISIHALLGRATRNFWRISRDCIYFNPRSPGESDLARCWRRKNVIFQSTLSWGERLESQYSLTWQVADFNPRSPGESDGNTLGPGTQITVFQSTLSWGERHFWQDIFTTKADFNPRSPGESDFNTYNQVKYKGDFNPRSPGESDVVLSQQLNTVLISIHALLGRAT